MITNNGKEIVAKFLLGQVSAYATHIGLGCGTRPSISSVRTITSRACSGNVATLTSENHGYRIGNVIDVSVYDGSYNGSFTVTAVDADSVSYALVHADEQDFAAYGTLYDEDGNSFPVSRRSLTSNVATLTIGNHTVDVGDQVFVSVTDTSYNGTFEVVDTTENTFSYVLSRVDEATSTCTGAAYLNIADKTNMDFEIIRVPITSRGYVTENGISKIALAGEMPTSDRMLITEASLWSAGSNINAKSMDSRMIYSFGQLEGWRYHTPSAVTDIPYRSILATDTTDIDKDFVGKVFSTTSDTPALMDVARQSRFEGGRVGNNLIILRGDSAKIDTTDAASRNGILSLDNSYANEHVHLDATALDLSKNGPDDEIRLAFFVVSQAAKNPTLPNKVRVYVEFLHSESTNTSGFAKFYGEINVGDINGNSYFVMSKKLSEMVYSGDFNWANVRNVRIYASAFTALNALDSNSFVALDSMRFENLSSINPLYAMVGYTPVNDGTGTNPKPIYKIANTSDYIEFRVNLGVA